MFDLSPDYFFFFFNDTATTEIYTLSLHDALPISHNMLLDLFNNVPPTPDQIRLTALAASAAGREADLVRSEEHTSELQSLAYLVCRLLLEKKKKQQPITPTQAQTHQSS